MTQIGINARPQAAVYLDGRPLGAIVPQIRVAGGFDVVSAAATITLDAIPGWIRKRVDVRVELGYVGQLLVPVFNRGFVEDDGRRNNGAVSNTIGAAGVLKNAQYQQKQNLSFSSQGARAIRASLLAAAGITDYDDSGDDSTLGTVKALTLKRGQAPIDLISRINQCLGDKIYDTPSGRPQCRSITGIPTAGAAFTYREADGNILDIDYPTTIRGTHNGVHVQGMPLEDGSTPNAYREATNPLLGDRIVVYEFNGGEIYQSQALVDAGALRLMGEVNREIVEVRVKVPGNPYLQPGITIGLEAPSVGLGLSNWWLMHYEHDWRAEQAISEMVLWGGLGDAGYSVDCGPHAQFTYKVERFTYEVLGVPTAMYLVTCDGTPSWDPDDPPDTLTFGWVNNKNADTESGPYYGTAFTPAEALDPVKPTITLTVTDPDGNTDSQTQEIDFGIPALYRELYIAAQASAYATPDGGATWNDWAPGGGVTVTATPRRNGDGWGVFGCSNGDLVYTADYLATAPTTLHNFGAQIAAIWLNEVDANRCLVALVSGKVMLSNNLSLLASSTWAEIKSYGEAVRWIAEDPFNRGQIWTCVGADLRLTFDEFVSEAVRATFTGGTAARFQGSPFGNVAVGAAAEPCRDDTGAAHPYPVLAPVVSDVRAVAHHIRIDRIWSADYSGRFFEKAVGDPAWTHVCDWAVGNVHDIMADGDEPTILYVGSDDGVYLSFDEGRTLALMLDLTGAGLAAVQLGYGGLDWATITPLTLVSTHGQGKCLSLWNGSGNDAPPDGWRNVAYDDSAWSAPVLASVGGGSVVPGSEAIWPTNTPVDGMEQALFRHTFTLSAGVVTSGTLHIHVDGFIVGVWLNNAWLGEVWSGFPANLEITLDTRLLIPGGDNVLAVHIDDHYLSGIDKAWHSFELVLL